MGRPRTNESNWWRGEGEEVEHEAMKVLTATATATLRRLDPRGSNFVEVGDLISEGWLRSMRYCKEAGQWDALRCMMHMRESYWRLRSRMFVAGKSARRMRVSDDYPLVCRRGQWGVRCLDLWDMIQVRCRPACRRMVLARWEGRGRREVACQEGVSGETVRLRCLAVRRALESDGIF